MDELDIQGMENIARTCTTIAIMNAIQRSLGARVPLLVWQLSSQRSIASAARTRFLSPSKFGPTSIMLNSQSQCLFSQQKAVSMLVFRNHFSELSNSASERSLSLLHNTSFFKLRHNFKNIAPRHHHLIPKNQVRGYYRGRNNFNQNLSGGSDFFASLLIKFFLVVRSVWGLVPDFLKLFLGFVVVSYFLIFIALPVLFVGLPILIILGYLYSRGRSLVNSRVSKLYTEYLSNSSLKLTGQSKVGFNNYNHPAKLHRLHSLVNRRINLAFEFNENNIQNMLKNFISTKDSFIDNRSFDSRLKLSDPISIKSESDVSGTLNINSSRFDSLIIYEFWLLETDFRDSKQHKTVAQANLIVGRPKNDRGGLDENEQIFEELFLNHIEEEDQPFIIEIISLGLSLKRYVINTNSAYDNPTTDRIITINDYKTKTYDN